MNLDDARDIIDGHMQRLRQNGRGNVADALADALETMFSEYFKDEGPQEPAQEEIEWKIGEDYRCRYGLRRKMIAVTRDSKPVIAAVDSQGQIGDHVYIVDRQGMFYRNGRESDHDIIGPWEQPKKPERQLVKLLKRHDLHNQDIFRLWAGDDYNTNYWKEVGSAWVVEGEFVKEETESWEDL